MSTTQQPPQLRPLSVGEVLDASFKIVRQSFGVLAGCVLVVALPLNILDTLITTFSGSATTSTQPANVPKLWRTILNDASSTSPTLRGRSWGEY